MIPDTNGEHFFFFECDKFLSIPLSHYSVLSFASALVDQIRVYVSTSDRKIRIARPRSAVD